MATEYLDFNAISQSVPFPVLLNQLDIPFQDTGKELKGEGNFKFIINKEKNLFFCPTDQSLKGSVINFLAAQRNLKLRSAAIVINDLFISPPKEKDIPELELHDHQSIEKYANLRQSFEFGYCKKGIMNGKIAFKCHDADKKVIGYIGWNPKDNSWFYPKGFIRPVYNLEKANGDYCVLTVSPFDVLHIHNLGHSYVLGLLGRSATDSQLAQLKRFKRILLLHPDPKHLIPALSSFAFVKAPTLDKPITELELINQFF